MRNQSAAHGYLPSSRTNSIARRRCRPPKMIAQYPSLTTFTPPCTSTAEDKVERSRLYYRRKNTVSIPREYSNHFVRIEFSGTDFAERDLGVHDLNNAHREFLVPIVSDVKGRNGYGLARVFQYERVSDLRYLVEHLSWERK